MTFIRQIYDLFGNIINVANAEVAWLSNLAERNRVWKQLQYTRYNDFIKALEFRLLWLVKGDDKATQQCHTQEDTGNEEAGRPLAVQS
jgi:hypothetical protein